MHYLNKLTSCLILICACFEICAQSVLYVPAGSTITISNSSELTAAGTVRSAHGSRWLNNGTIRLLNGDWNDETAGGGYVKIPL